MFCHIYLYIRHQKIVKKALCMILKWIVKVQNVNVESVFETSGPDPARADSSKNSLAWIDWGYHYSLLEGAFNLASLTICRCPFLLLGGEGHCESKCFSKKHNTYWPNHVSNPNFSVTLKFSKLTMYMQYATLSPKRIL